MASAPEEVLATNRRFYEAFEARDLDAMSDIWEHADRISCTHPGWSTLHGWNAVVGSWFALFTNDQRLQFIVTEERVEVVGDAAWVTCEEHVLDGLGGGTVAAVNLFARGPAGWRMVGHHGTSVIVPRQVDGTDT
jgi:ketosteroid isomerase-like protein